MGAVVTPAEPPELSVVVPVYNGDAFVYETIHALITHLAARDQPVELIIVDDGSTDTTPALLRQALTAVPIPVQLLRNERNAGKGAAIARGMHAARGRYRVFLDADLAYPPSEIERLCAALTAGADVAIASRPHPSSRVLLTPSFFTYFYLRYVAGRLFNWIVRMVLLPGITDSQAGLKGFTATAADKLFRGWLPRGFSFDLAVLFRATRLGLGVVQVPVLYRQESEPSTVRFVRDMIRGVRDIAQIRLRFVRGGFEQWGTVLDTWRGQTRISLLAGMQSEAARAVLLTTCGLALIALFLARLVLRSGAVAAVSWLTALVALAGLVWRLDLQRPQPRLRLFGSVAEGAGFAGVLLVGAMLRLIRLGDVPPMVHGDSAECGLLGLALLRGEVPNVFGFSPWYDTMYVSFVPYAASLWLTGASAVGLRLPSAILGAASIVPLYFLVRAWWGTRAAMAVTGLYAASHGAIHFSRIGLWNIQALFCELTAFAFLVVGVRHQRRVWLTAAGIVSGLALYTYTAGRIVAVVAGAFLLTQLIRDRRAGARMTAYYLCGFVIAASPLLMTYLKHPELLERDRTASVFVFAEESQPHVEATLGTTSAGAVLWEQFKRTIAGFVTRGDSSTQYGTQQPLLSPLTALLAGIGLGVAIVGWREPRHLFVLLWAGLGVLLGSVVIIDPPSYTRLLILVPVPYILAAAAIERAAHVAERLRLPRRTEFVLIGYLLLVAQSAGFDLIGYQQFVGRMRVMSREWDVLAVLRRLGNQYDYYFYTGPFLLADSPIFRFFSAETRAVSGFSEADLPDHLARDAAFVLTPDFRRVGLAITERFPGVEREVREEEGVRQLIIYRCTAQTGCRPGSPS
ncbi:MAG: glycosyltransferase [Deltaproteobacteria bacterium]|nr:glycosyltransferase [Deltaproteobacteria bacterium]